MHGIGQGNGSGPAIWVVVSTPILNMLRQANVGSFLQQPISLKPIRFSGFSFMDDTDTTQTARDATEGWQEVAQGLQHSLDIWQGDLHATGGAIVPAKTSWNLTDFKWQGGNWTYKAMADMPARLTVKDIEGTEHVLRRLEHATEGWQEVAQGLQHSLDIWQGDSHATGGAIVPAKTSWNLTDFKWQGGNWTYKAMADMPARLTVKDIEGTEHVLRRLEHNQATLLLGIDIAPDGNMTQQFETLKKATTLWATQIQKGRLSHADAWLALTSTIWKSIFYPLPATCLSKQQCEAIMVPAINQALVTMGFCRHFPRDVVFALQK
jgi:hypothetical protein